MPKIDQNHNFVSVLVGFSFQWGGWGGTQGLVSHSTPYEFPPYVNKVLGIDRFTLNRFLPIPILTDFENFNLTDTDTDTEN